MGCQLFVAAGSRSPEDIRGHQPSQSPSCCRRRKSDKKADLQQQPPDFAVEVEKRREDKLGVTLGTTRKGAAIFNLQAGGLLARYNAQTSEERKLRAGFVIVDVNGRTGYWDMFEEMRKIGLLKMVISPTAPSGSSVDWFDEVENMGRDLEAKGKQFVVRVKHDKDHASTFCTLPMMRAGDIGVDQCAICLGDVEPNESLVGLRCNHAFHVTCAGRWLTQKGHHARGRRHRCPLCCRPALTDSVEG